MAGIRVTGIENHLGSGADVLSPVNSDTVR
jgi:hypothetical protein